MILRGRGVRIVQITAQITLGGQNILYSSFVDKSYQHGDLSHNKLKHTDAQ